jgi:excinuclease ABC subunit A
MARAGSRFNVKGGRCEACQGDGVIKIEMHFLPDVYVTCDVCKGKRYNRETLEIVFKGKSIADVLDMTVEEAADFFKAVPPIRDKMLTLERVGLGYIKVGPAGDHPVGRRGPARQAVEGAVEARDRSHPVYPRRTDDRPAFRGHPQTAGSAARTGRGQGNTIVVIEHNLDVIKVADYLIDFGPEGGDGGGEIVAVGTPEQVADNKASWTGKYLKEVLDRHEDRRKARVAALGLGLGVAAEPAKKRRAKASA